ncbi:MAG: glycosyltransferase [Rhodobacteraceae bacterium]|nr:glycosyltransferase [Paracoccaceae bacterium]
MNETIETFSFNPDMLTPADRLPGISAFMRIRNGADFLEATIRTHADMYDEIVAVYNQCTDETANILMRLSAELGPKLRVYHYLPHAHPAGSDGHARTPGDAPNSLVTYSNFALCQTRHQWAVKLDDDHLAIPGAVKTMTDAIRSGAADERIMHCFSGLNLVRNDAGLWRVPAVAPVSGKGDIGYFRVSNETYFSHDRRFERFVRGGIKRQFAGWFYWHLKYLKSGGGFANYDLAANPDSRYARRLTRLQLGALWDLDDTRRALSPGPLRRLRAAIDTKARLAVARDAAITAAFPQNDLTAALDATAPRWQQWLDCAQ